MRVLNLVAAAVMGGLFSTSASAASIGIDCGNGAGEAVEIACVLGALAAIPVDTTGVVALGKLGTAQIPSGVETEDYGLGLDAVTTDETYSGGELKTFDMALDAVAGYSLFAVYIKAGSRVSNGGITGFLYYGGMFDDMGGPGGKEISHASYFGKVSLSEVPLPAGLPLLIAGLGGFALLRRKR